ncbi:Small-conductance mechanosensitive channel [BD1-7 clade bacterium]|uniref:Small-conductance mechanosensitive channel n=1 Tax=BD1-7 clade bacterium TaxID=2029982 RepID=A0A5S9MQL7_9GAMM|nr:Small-conductance mechanosensitive channel [BD1-7 clade bacterium]CAA0085080.1 Small-conductance mechanosensitive channel [BD1-7 clade bacterium]
MTSRFRQLCAVCCFLVSALVVADTPDVSVKHLIDSEQDQLEALEDAQSKVHRYVDEHFRDTPRSSMLGFMRATAEGNYEQAANFLDTRYLPDDVKAEPAEELARKLQVVLDQRLWVDVSKLSDSNKGEADDGLPSYRDLIGSIANGSYYYDILFQRVPGSDGQFIWKFSNQTVAQVPELYSLFGYNRIEEWLDDNIPHFKVFGIQSWLWMLALMSAAITFVFVTPFCLLAVGIIRRHRPATGDRIRRFALGPVRFMLVLYLTGILLQGFHLSLEAQAFAQTHTFHIIVNAWFLIMVIGFMQEYGQTRLELKGQKDMAVLLKPLASVSRILVLISGLLVWFNNMGIDVTTMVAGLGIGGLAIALAAQKSLENLIGTVTIFMTSPIKVGDFCLVQGSKGMVEEIGLWATKIRTLDRSVVFIPNSQVSAGVIENFSMRDKFTFSRVLYLDHVTTEEKISQAMDAVRHILETHEMVDDQIRRVNLETIGEFGFEVQVFAQIRTTDLNEYKQEIAGINLQINKVMQDLGVVYAKPLSNLTSKSK